MLSECQIEKAIRCLDNTPWSAAETKFLDQLFRENSGKFYPWLVAAQLASLDVMYGVGMWRRSNANRDGINIDLYEPKPKLAINRYLAEAPAIWNQLHEVGLANQDLENVEEGQLDTLNQCHLRLASLNGGKEEVLASKYLHFCFPRLFPIIDSAILSILKSRGEIRNKSFRTVLAWYKTNLSKEWITAIRTWDPDGRGSMTPVRAVDFVLWIVGLGVRFNDHKRINKEVQLYFEANPDVAKGLLDWPEE